MTGAAVVAVALAGAVTPAQAREATMPIKNGKAEFCLTKPAAKRLAEAKIKLVATGKARLTGKQRQCVSLPLTEGTRDYAKLQGGLSFRDRDDRLDLSKVHNYVDKTPRTVVHASVNRAKARQAQFLNYTIKRDNAQVTQKQIKAVDVRTALTGEGEKLFKKTFGKSPLREGEHVFHLNAVADLPKGAPDALAALLGSLG
ncbi:hypothetical protein AAHZ94_07175 [Streptomyces sp. HSW2009]|uniref:hypothetical protein n=1 Tax=Streptomyces sp. HSW2009 TaxID=3142890 RepID=UPI0032EDC26B